MIRIGEKEIRAKVEKILGDANRGYLLTEFKDGFKVYISDQPLIYVFEYEELSGWIVYIDLREDNFNDPIFVEDPEYTAIEKMIDKHNFDHFTYAEETTQKFIKDSVQIESFFKMYEKLIDAQIKDGNELTYRFKKIKGLQPIIHISYAPGMDYWNLSYKSFMKDTHVIDALYEVFQGAEELIYSINKANLHED